MKSHNAEDQHTNQNEVPEGSSPKKKDIKSFSDLLNNFPMIARQMQPGLERLFNEFGKELGKPLPPPPSRTSSRTSSTSSTTGTIERTVKANGSIHSGKVGVSVRLPSSSAEFLDDEEDFMRRALETTVTSAIDLFQLVDKQQLSNLGATTDLTGPLVERLIERYVAEQVHDSLLFPRLCAFHKLEDAELGRRIRQMENVDVSQVGIAIQAGRQGKNGLMQRLNKGVEAFRKMGVAGSPQEMLEVLVETERAVTSAPESPSLTPPGASDVEKQSEVMTVNADILVSLLLIVVIQSQVRHLQTRLSYMQRFIYIDDVESGEIGYTLSTFEAVLSYLTKDAGGLRKASLRNIKLWQATKDGRVGDLQAIMESDDHGALNEEHLVEEPKDFEEPMTNGVGNSPGCEARANGTINGGSCLLRSNASAGSFGSGLSHVFPFEAVSSVTSPTSTAKSGKRVSMDVRSLSSSSAMSFRSRTTTIGSSTYGLEGDTSVESLAQTQDPEGNSVLMMAVEARQPESLRYLLTLPEFYPLETVLADMKNDGTTLLSTAIQLAHTEMVDIILNFVYQSREEKALPSYLARADKRGRTAAHYLFNAPQLISRLNNKLPWRAKDKIGQTPLFALCRSYDHPHYSSMVSEALTVAKEAQDDGLPLRVEDHVDHKGNTLLHIVNDAVIIHRILHHCDSDPNAVNDKKFTPLMLASKYGRVDMVRIFFSDPRIDLHLKEFRGLTAVELAKDDEVRNRIDDFTLFSDPFLMTTPDSSGRVTTIVRSFFVDDGSIRFILKSGAPSNASDPSSTTYTITTSRRTLKDFDYLAYWLAMEHPASYIPKWSPVGIRSPFQIHSRPSRAVLHDIHMALDRFLKIMLAHPTFSTHELLWEFFLVPDIQWDQIAPRSRLKAQLLSENIADEYEPISDLRDVESVVAHSREMVRGLSLSTRQVVRCGYQLQHAYTGLSDALGMCSAALSTMAPPADALPKAHVDAFARYLGLMNTSVDSSPLTTFVHTVSSFHATILAMQTSLLRPTNLITQLSITSKAVARHRQNLNSQSLPRKFNFPGQEESRVKNMKDAEKKIAEGEADIVRLGKELRWTQEVVVGELAGWTGWREKVGRESVRSFVKAMVVKERERGKGLERCVRALREANQEKTGS